jgi:hypothetical protein
MADRFLIFRNDGVPEALCCVIADGGEYDAQAQFLASAENRWGATPASFEWDGEELPLYFAVDVDALPVVGGAAAAAAALTR